MGHDKLHATDHTDGTDDIQDATAGQKGLATAAQITKLDGIAAGADVTGSNPPQAHSLAGAEHNADTLANLNGKVSDGTLVNADGIAGGQTVIGGTAASDPLTLQASSDAARGPVEVDATVLRVTNTPGPEGGCLQLKMPNGNPATIDSETNTSTRIFVTEAVDHTFTLFNNGAGVMNFSLLGEQTITNGTDATGSGGSLTDGDLLTTGGIAVQKSAKVQTTIEAGSQVKGSAFEVLADESWGLTGDAGVKMADLVQTALKFYIGSASYPMARTLQLENDPVLTVTKYSAGVGDSGIQTHGQVKRKFTVVTSYPYTVLDNDHHLFCSNGPGTINLPQASLHSGRELIVKKVGASGTITIDGNGAETIDGNATLALTTQYDSRIIVSNGSEWFVTGRK